MLKTVEGEFGIVSAPHSAASQSGLEVLKDGGSAVEAAVAVAATLAVVYPHMNSIGGDSFWLIRHPDGSMDAIDACGAASINVSPQLYMKHHTIPWRGPLAANTVAGTVSGWQECLVRARSKLPLERLLRDAIRFAENGIDVISSLTATIESKVGSLSSIYGFADVFLKNGHPPEVGSKLRQPALAESLKLLSSEGLSSFYHGELARRIAHDLEIVKSPVCAQDLASHAALSVKPLYTQISNAKLWNLPPPTQGVASLLILAIYDRLQVSSIDSFEHIHSIVEATKHAFTIRDSLVGDPAYMNFDCQGMLDDPVLLRRFAMRVNREKAMPWPRKSMQGDTVWFGAADRNGQVVSAIQSTYFEFGSGIVLPKTGIIWQNRGASFKLNENGWNGLKPKRKPFHTLNPAMAVFDDGRVMAYGTMGGEGQPQTQAAIFTRYNAGMDIQEAISSPRWLLGRTWGQESTSLKVEDSMPSPIQEALDRAGHFVEVVPSNNAMMGHAGAVIRLPNGRMQGATDPRSDGMVAAW
jgi:gamma-glutamyltranspeptidase